MKISHGRSFWLHLLISFVAIFVLYLPSLHSGFILDDHIGIEQNQSIKSVDTVFATPIASFRTALLHLSYSLGELNPAYYRIMNIAFHFATAVSAYVLVRLLVSSASIAFFSALVFAVHPILVESVVWISSLTYPQYSFFALAALIFYIQRLRSKHNTTYTVLCLLSFILSVLSSEKALVIPLILFMYEWLFGSLKKNWKIIAFCFAVITLIGFMMFPYVQDRISTFSASAVSGTTELINPFVQVPTVLGTYISLIFWPQRLTIYHLDELGLRTVPLVINSLLTIIYFAGLIVSFVKSKKIFFFLLIFVIASLPALIPIHIIQIAAERYAYLGTFGLITATILFLFELIKKYKLNRKILYVTLSVCVIALAWRTTARAKDWESEIILRLATLRTAPYSARAHNNVGIQLMNEGRDEEALIEYKKAIKLRPDYSHPYHNIGHMLALRARYEESVPFYLKAMEFNKYEWKTRQDLGQVYFLLQKYPEAKEQLLVAIEQGSPQTEKLNTILNKIEELGY